MIIFWKVMKILGYFLFLITLFIVIGSGYNEFNNFSISEYTSIFGVVGYVVGSCFVKLLFFIPSVFLIKITDKKIELLQQIPSKSKIITKEIAKEIEIKGVEILDSILDELKDKEVGTNSQIRIFNGDYRHYHKFFQSLPHFKNHDKNSCMFVIFEKNVSIGISLVNLDKDNTLSINGERLK